MTSEPILGTNTELEELGLKPCLKSKLTKSCRCIKGNQKWNEKLKENRKINIQAIQKEQAKKAAEEIFKQLEKNISSITMDIMSLDSYSYKVSYYSGY